MKPNFFVHANRLHLPFQGSKQLESLPKKRAFNYNRSISLTFDDRVVQFLPLGRIQSRTRFIRSMITLLSFLLRLLSIMGFIAGARHDFLLCLPCDTVGTTTGSIFRVVMLVGLLFHLLRFIILGLTLSARVTTVTAATVVAAAAAATTAAAAAATAAAATATAAVAVIAVTAVTIGTATTAAATFFS